MLQLESVTFRAVVAFMTLKKLQENESVCVCVCACGGGGTQSTSSQPSCPSGLLSKIGMLC